LTAEDIALAMSIAASQVPSEQTAESVDALVPKATIGICNATPISETMAMTAGLGSGLDPAAAMKWGDSEVVHVKVENSALTENPFDTNGLACDAFGVAVRDMAGEWVVKWVLDPPRNDGELDDCALGAQGVTIATAIEGLVIATGTVEVLPRPEKMAPSIRYNFNESNSAVAKLQAVRRGKSVRDQMKEQKHREQAVIKVQAGVRGKEGRKVTRKKRQTTAATKLQALQRGRSGRKFSRQNVLTASGWGGVFYISTKKPLICRTEWSLESERQSEAAPNTRVVVLDTFTMDDGVVRALIQQEDGTEPLGWLTASKEGAKSLWPAPPKVAED